MRGVHPDKIRKAHINAYIAQRLKAGISPRTVNLDVGAVHNVFNRAIDDGWINALPTAKLAELEQNQRVPADAGRARSVVLTAAHSCARTAKSYPRCLGRGGDP